MLTGLKVQPQRGCDGETNDFTEPRFFYTFLTFLIHTQDEKEWIFDVGICVFSLSSRDWFPWYLLKYIGQKEIRGPPILLLFIYLFIIFETKQNASLIPISGKSALIINTRKPEAAPCLGLDRIHVHAGDALILLEMSAHVRIWESCQSMVSVCGISTIGGWELWRSAFD